MQIQCKMKFIICPFSDSTEKYYISNPVSSPVSFLTQMPSVPLNLHLLRGQKPLNRKLPTSSTDMLCDWSPAISLLHLCCIYLSTHKMMRNIMDAGPKCIGVLGSLLNDINPPHLHSSFLSLVINIYYFPPSLCTAWQCSTALGPVAVEPGVTKENTKRCKALLHFQATPDNESGRNFCSFPSLGEGVFSFCSSDESDLTLSPDFHSHFVSWSLLERFSCWQVLLERWCLEVVWNLRIFLSEAALRILKSSRRRRIPSAAWALFASWAALGTSATASNSDVTTLSFQIRCISVQLCLRLLEGPAGSDFYSTRELLGWVLWSAKWTISLSKELRVQRRAAISTVPRIPSSKNRQSFRQSLC